jgi:hypothetical protein
LALAEECTETQYYKNPNFKMFPDEVRESMRHNLQQRDKALVATMFLTGGRITEVLMSRSENFVVEDDFVIVINFPLLKRYSVVTEVSEESSTPPTDVTDLKAWKWDKETGNFKKYKRTVTPIIMKRPDFPIPRWEPLCEYLIQKVKDSEGWLFPTDWNLTIKRYGTKGVLNWIDEEFKIEQGTREWISPQRALQIVSGAALRADLTVEKKGVKSLGIWNHWIRSERASELARDYQFNDRHLNAFFGWAESRESKSGTASQYTKTGEVDLEDQMKENQERFKRQLERDLKR